MYRKLLRACVFAVLGAACPWVQAAFHLWKIAEIYSGAGGAVQFIELSTTVGGQQFIAGHTITITQGTSTRSFTFSTNLPGNSANKSFLIGTQSFAALNIVAPDYIVPDNFLFLPGGVADFAGVDTFAYSLNPTGGGVSSGGASSVFGTPTNFAGQTGSIPAATPGAPTLVSAVPGNTQATISFFPPGSFGASAITGYRVTCNPGAVIANGSASPITVAGLTNAIPYSCSVVAFNSAGAGPPSSPVSVTPVGASAVGTASGPSATGTGIITASFSGGGAGCTFASSQFIAVEGSAASPPAGSAPAGVVFPQGLFAFSLTGCTPASAITMTVVYPTPLPPGTQYWKYGPTAAQPSPHWYTLPATLAGNIASFIIADGGLGDDDLAANGVIVDQGGPGAPLPPGVGATIPTLDEWALIILAAMLAAAGMATRAPARTRTASTRR